MLNTIVIISFSIFLVAICLELWYSHKKKLGYYELKDSFVSFGFGVFGVITRVATKGIFLLVWFWLYELTPLRIQTGVLSFIGLFLANEFIYYWFHRLSHEYRILWATHVNHHSSEYMNFATAARTPFLNAIYHFIFWLPLPLLGFHPVDILVVETVSFLFAYFQHTRFIPKLGFLEWFMNTPSHHRVHHAKNEKYLDKNYGNVLIIFDRLFGTFQVEEEEPVFGIADEIEDRSFPNIVFHEWKNIIRDWKEGRPAVKVRGNRQESL